MTKLSVNVNKIATLRNARGQDFPNVLKVAEDILSFGSHGITVHPRPDERHITRQDVLDLSALLTNWKGKDASLEFNVEGYPAPEFLELIEKVRPDQCTLVPDPPDAITSNAGWQFAKNEAFLTEVCAQLRTAGVRTSLFLDPMAFKDPEFEALKRIKPDRVELYTESYAKSFGSPEQELVIKPYAHAARIISDAGMMINAGHDLNLKNLGFLLESVPEISEVSIGHALVVESLYQGFESVIKEYLKIVS